MEFLRNRFVESDLNEGKILTSGVLKWTKEAGTLEDHETVLLKSYFLGYWLVQKSGEFVSYESLPYYKILKFIPPISLVVNAAKLATRVGREILDETNDLEHIIKAGGSHVKEIRNLANNLSGVITNNFNDEIATPSGRHSYDELKVECNNIIANWFMRPANQPLEK